MRVLLDTHVLLWALADDPRLGPEARRAVVEGPSSYSAASIWELSIKHSVGKVGPPDAVVDAALRAGLDELPVGTAHALAVAGSPLRHRDPFDRLLVAQARVEGLTLLTADTAILAVGLPDVLDARL